MSNNLGNNYKNAPLDSIFGIGTPATLYAALFTSAPTSSGGGTEVTTGVGYARVAVTNNNTNFPAASGGIKSNGTAITFPTASGAGWGNVTSWALMDASSGGNIVFWDNFQTSRTVLSGDGPQFAIGALTITVS